MRLLLLTAVALAVAGALAWVALRALALAKRAAGERSPEQQLIRRVLGDRDAAERLIRYEQKRAPEISRGEAARRALDRLEYERSR